MKNNNKNNDINIKTIWKFLKSEKGKRYSFIIFYLFFFIFLFIFMNTDVKTDNKKNNKINNEVEETIKMSSLPFDTNNLENNYNFTYLITCPNKTNYQGTKSNNIYQFKNSNEIKEFKLINGELTGDNSIDYIDFVNVYFLRQIIKNSKLISETKLNETNNYIYTYEIKNNILGNYLNEDIKNDKTTTIVVNTNSNKIIKSIKIDLASYKENDLCNIEYKLEND